MFSSNIVSAGVMIWDVPQWNSPRTGHILGKVEPLLEFGLQANPHLYDTYRGPLHLYGMLHITYLRILTPNPLTQYLRAQYLTLQVGTFLLH